MNAICRCVRCQRLAPIWQKLAESFADVEAVTIAEVDCSQHFSLCQEHGVSWSVSVYTLAYFYASPTLLAYGSFQQRNIMSVCNCVPLFVPQKLLARTVSKSLFCGTQTWVASKNCLLHTVVILHLWIISYILTLIIRAVPNILFVFYLVRIVGRIVYSYSAEQ